MFYSYVEIEYVAIIFSPARTDLALKLLTTVYCIRGAAPIGLFMKKSGRKENLIVCLCVCVSVCLCVCVSVCRCVCVCK
jgi:hypothetical protein